MNTLFARLAAVLLVIVVGMGGAFHVVDRSNTRLYYEELAQSLNAPIAMYIAEQQPLIRNGIPDLAALAELADRAMVINPAAEIYLLDLEGRILGSGVPPETLSADRVDVSTVRELIAGRGRLPLRGDDPRDPSTRKIFSAAEVHSSAGPEGYVYVVIGGKTYEALASDIRDSYAGRSSIVALVTIAALAAALGLLTFGLLTRRLKKLRAEVHRVIESGFEYLPGKPAHPDRDEIDALEVAFADMAKRIAEQVDQLQENDRLRRELITNISHDLKTPLAAMQGYVETMILRNDSLDADGRLRFLSIVDKHTQRLGRLISDLFELSRLDAASVSPSIDSFSLPELIQDVSQEFLLEAERKGIELEIEMDAKSGQTVGDIGLIQRVLENLVRNAVKFTPRGGKVVISVEEQRHGLAVAVSDNGPGIADEDLPKIFDRFYRARDGEEARSDSSGIGLAIVKRILDLHGSRITVVSRLDAGTRFEFELPHARRDAA